MSYELDCVWLGQNEPITKFVGDDCSIGEVRKYLLIARQYFNNKFVGYLSRLLSGLDRSGYSISAVECVGCYCSKGEIKEYLQVAITSHNADFTKYLLSLLAYLKESELFVWALVQAVRDGIERYSGIYWAFLEVFSNNHERLGLVDVWNNYVCCEGYPQAVELLLNGTEFADRFTECECSTQRISVEEHDGRLDRFLHGFEKFGAVIIKLGYCRHDGGIEYTRVLMQEGRISQKDSGKVLHYLDVAGVRETLPEFHGRWQEKFYLEGSDWRSIGARRGDGAVWFWIECLACTEPKSNY